MVCSMIYKIILYVIEYIMAFTFFKHNPILPKDICDYIITFVGYSDDDVIFFKLFT